MSMFTVEVATFSVNKMKIMDYKLNIYTKFYSVDTSGEAATLSVNKLK